MCFGRAKHFCRRSRFKRVAHIFFCSSSTFLFVFSVRFANLFSVQWFCSHNNDNQTMKPKSRRRISTKENNRLECTAYTTHVNNINQYINRVWLCKQNYNRTCHNSYRRTKKKRRRKTASQNCCTSTDLEETRKRFEMLQSN